jgi:hypothetical protein
MVDDNVLTPIDDGEMTGTASDATSIMCYHLPASIMNDGKAVLGGGDVNSTDLEFCHTIYPPSSAAPRRVADLQIPKVIRLPLMCINHCVVHLTEQ